MKTKLPTQPSLGYEEITDLLNRALASIVWISPVVNPKVGMVEPGPEYRRDGHIAYANGVDWNPAGDGTKGYFCWQDGGWVSLGGSQKSTDLVSSVLEVQIFS